jgi:hypothetical protein
VIIVRQSTSLHCSERSLPSHIVSPAKPLTIYSMTMSSIASLAARRAFARQTLARAPPRRFLSTSKVEESGLDKAPKRDPELYVRHLCH